VSPVRIGIDARLVARGLGIARFVTGLVDNLDVEVVWFGDPALAPRPVGTVRADRLPHVALDLGAARRLALRAGVDVMHFTANTGWTSPGRPPFVLTVHDLLFLDTPIRGRSLRQVLGHRYARRNVIGAVAAASAVATPSAASAADIVARARAAPFPVVIPNGVDLPAVSPPRDPPAHGGYAVAFSGRDPRKGVELAVAGWRAADRTPPRLWLLAGAGLPPGLEQDIAADVSAGRIVVSPYLPRPRLVEIVAAAAVLIYPSRAEGFGLPVIEAMAAGIPVISGLAPATREVGGDAILRVDGADPVASIAAALRLLATDRGLAERLAAAGRARAESYSWRACACAYMDLYRAAADAGVTI
jgi:glycosyltransferase involved in cell wall biosynthesis